MTGPPAAEDAVTCEAVVPAPPEEVFRWSVRPELLVRWIGIDARLDPRPGGRFRFEITDGQWCSGQGRPRRGPGPRRAAPTVQS